MKRRFSALSNQLRPEHETPAQIGCWTVELLPSAPYEVSYTPEQSIIGYSFDRQSGTHAFASDKQRTFEAVPNGLAWVPAGCDDYSQSSGGEYLKISCSHELHKARDKQWNVSNIVDPAAIKPAFALRRALLSKNEIDHLACESWLRSMESSVIKALSGSHNVDQTKGWMTRDRIKQIREFIDSRLDTQLTVSVLALEFGISAGFFSREFKRSFGRSPHQYIIDQRLTSARKLLLQSQQDLSAIAYACGFSSHSHMTAQFKSTLGITPARLRQTARKVDCRAVNPKSGQLRNRF